MKKRCGFSQIELLAVIAIIGILVAFLMMGVQAARSAARRVQCQNNIKQLGIAITQYHDTFEMLPKFSGNHLSVHVQMLPYLEQDNLFDKFNLTAEPGEIEWNINDEVCHERPHFFVCPSEPVEQPLATNYLLNNGFQFQHGFNGVVCNYRQFVRLSHFKSIYNTVAFAEGKLFDRVQQPRSDSAGIHLDNALPYVANDFHKSIDNDGSLEQFSLGFRWHEPYGSDYTHLLPPGKKSYSSQWGSVRHRVFTPGSYHPGGTNVVHLDGSVEFVANLIDEEVWQKKGTRKGKRNRASLKLEWDLVSPKVAAYPDSVHIMVKGPPFSRAAIKTFVGRDHPRVMSWDVDGEKQTWVPIQTNSQGIWEDRWDFIPDPPARIPFRMVLTPIGTNQPEYFEWADFEAWE